MGLLEQVEVMHTLDQLSDDQHATLISQIFTVDRTMTSQVLAGYFETNNNAELITRIKQTAKSILQSQESEKEAAAQTVMTDPHILSNIARFLPNHRITRLELLSRRSFISLRKYPAIYDLQNFEIINYLKYCSKLSMASDMYRLRNVRVLSLNAWAIKQLSAYTPHPIFKKVEDLYCSNTLNVLPQLMSICDSSTIECLWISGNQDMSLRNAMDLFKLILSCINLKRLTLSGLKNSSSDVSFQNIWSVQDIRKQLTNLKALNFEESVDNDIKRTLFKALAPQLKSLHFRPRGKSSNIHPSTTLSLSSLLRECTDYRNLRELCWTIYDESDLANCVKILQQSQLNNLKRICLFYIGSNLDYDITDEETQANLVSFFKRNWEHIAVVEFYGKLGHELISCLKKGLLQREEGGALSIELPNFNRNNGAENDMIDIVAIANVSKLERFAVIRCEDTNQELLRKVPNCVTASNRLRYLCCRTEIFTAKPWIHECEHCEYQLYEGLL